MGFLSGCGPIFLKEQSDTKECIERLQCLSERAAGDLKKEIDRQIKLASFGEAGEQNIAFELRNSGMDMVILHDIYLEHDNLSAQIDYLIITKKHLYVIECKNLIGDIEIDNKGSFIRTYVMHGKKIKEGIYSPITQNEHHMNVIKEVRKDSKKLLEKTIFEKNFSNNYKSIICLANPKTVLNDRYAKKEIKNRVIRADQLIAYIKEVDSKQAGLSMSEKQMKELAQFFLTASKPNKSDYTRKYEELLKQVDNVEENQEKESNTDIAQHNEEEICPRCGNKLVRRIAKRGNHAGNQFYGCSAYPKCRYIKI